MAHLVDQLGVMVAHVLMQLAGEHPGLYPVVFRLLQFAEHGLSGHPRVSLAVAMHFQQPIGALDDLKSRCDIGRLSATR